MEHLHEGASALVENPLWRAEYEERSAKSWVAEQAGLIDQGKVAEVMAECRNWASGEDGHPLARLAGYLESRQGQLDYAAAREAGMPVGSGAVEGGHRHVIQARLKLPGAWWKVDAVNPMLALRTLRANGRWEAFWH